MIIITIPQLALRRLNMAPLLPVYERECVIVCGLEAKARKLAHYSSPVILPLRGRLGRETQTHTQELKNELNGKRGKKKKKWKRKKKGLK